MKIRKTILAAIVLATIPMAAKAQNADNYKNYRVSCQADCHNFDVIYQQNRSSDRPIAQRTRRRRTRPTTSNRKFYLGVNGGAFFTGEPANTGFGPSIVGGYQFNENLGAELEGFYYFGGLDEDSIFNDFQQQQIDAGNIDIDLGYNNLGIAANFMGKYPFNKNNPKSIYGIAGFGLGYSRLQLNVDISDATQSVSQDVSFSGFLLNSKFGLGLPVSNALDVTAQFRYGYAFYGDAEIEGITIPSADDDFITIDLGARFNF